MKYLKSNVITSLQYKFVIVILKNIFSVSGSIIQFSYFNNKLNKMYSNYTGLATLVARHAVHLVCALERAHTRARRGEMYVHQYAHATPTAPRQRQTARCSRARAGWA